jgi:hypothetical protein
MRAFDGNGDRAQSNIFLAVEAGEQQGLVSNDNLYCTIGDAPARFVWLGDLLELEAFRSAAGSDAGSRALPATDPACTAF